ncbi:hypothetical protein [Sphingomonas sp. SUN039]|uniref:hypothetical protein n=1 Tax=Sphingomonas sp. SUN039 TaxID=2937787 RepID=UPI002164CC06|nr:hypothetical protein [Sphingomonas sp. SUN039]UVO53316.1 hypothetical protein M0209_03960 [Sphingomonas sp. SUN039]
MIDHSPRLFATDAEVRRIGLGLLDRSLPRADWTHEAHLAACHWIVSERPDIDPDSDLRDIISRYNESVGGVNDDSQGYHETITRCFVHAVRQHRSHGSLVDRVNALLLSPCGNRSWPLNFYSHARLFSVAARRDFIEPDLAPLPAL